MYTQTIAIDVVPGAKPPELHISQYDKGSRTINFMLYASDGSLSIPSGATASINGTKPDGTGFDYVATISGTTITATLTEQMAAVAGKVPTKLIVENNGEKLLTQKILIIVDRAALDKDTIRSDSEIRQIIDVVDRAEEILDAAELIEGSAQQIQQNTDDITDLKEDLSELGLSYAAKQAIINCFNHLAWKDDQGTSCINALIDSMAIEFSYPALLQLQKQKSGGHYQGTLGIYEYGNNIRMLITMPTGELPYKHRTEDRYYDFYPIPVPEGAKSVIANTDNPDNIQVSFSAWKLMTDHYEGFAGQDSGWQNTPYEYIIPSGDVKKYLVLALRNKTNTDVPAEQIPSSVVMAFKY